MRTLLAVACVVAGIPNALASGLPQPPAGITLVGASRVVACSTIMEPWMLIRASKASGAEFEEVYELLKTKKRCKTFSLENNHGALSYISSYIWYPGASMQGAWVYELHRKGSREPLYVVSEFPRDDAASLP